MRSVDDAAPGDAGDVHLERARHGGDLDADRAHPDDEEVLPRDRAGCPAFPAPLRHLAEGRIHADGAPEEVPEHVLRDALREVPDVARQGDTVRPLRTREPGFHARPSALDPAKLWKAERRLGGRARA